MLGGQQCLTDTNLEPERESVCTLHPTTVVESRYKTLRYRGALNCVQPACAPWHTFIQF